MYKTESNDSQKRKFIFESHFLKNHWPKWNFFRILIFCSTSFQDIKPERWTKKSLWFIPHILSYKLCVLLFYVLCNRRIADNASQLVRSLGSREGFEPFFDRFYREPLRRVVEAYQPLSKGETWQDVLSRPEFSDVKVTESGIRVIPGKVGIKG